MGDLEKSNVAFNTLPPAELQQPRRPLIVPSSLKEGSNKINLDLEKARQLALQNFDTLIIRFNLKQELNSDDIDYLRGFLAKTYDDIGKSGLPNWLQVALEKKLVQPILSLVEKNLQRVKMANGNDPDARSFVENFFHEGTYLENDPLLHPKNLSNAINTLADFLGKIHFLIQDLAENSRQNGNILNQKSLSELLNSAHLSNDILQEAGLPTNEVIADNILAELPGNKIAQRETTNTEAAQ